LLIRTRSLALSILLCGLITLPAFAEGTRTWEQSKFEDLTKGTAKGVAISSRGGLELAPSLKALATTPSTYIWSIAADEAGNIYAAAGAPARLYRVTPDGKSSIIFEPKELQVQALIVDKLGAIYAATTPDGKVYRIERRGATSTKVPEKGGPADPETDGSEAKVDPAWTSSVYFDPGTKYIWDLASDHAGNMYVATGDHGEIYRVSPNGEHSVFFKSDEAHIRVLAVDPKGNLIAGTDGSGLVYRISPSGEAFVLYSAPKKEITALTIDAAGNIYAAGVGEKRPGGPPVPATTTVAPMPQASGPVQTPGAITVMVQPSPAAPMMGSFPAPGAGASGGSEVYRIAPDGSPLRIWSSREDIVYGLALDARGHLLAATGNRGHIFAIRSEDDYSDLLHVSASQVTALTKGPAGDTLYASTSNLGKVFALGSTPGGDGSYESDVFDARIFSRWGRVEYRGRGNVELFARSGNVDNPDRNWSPWKKIDLSRGAVAEVPPARFIQWKAVLHAGTPAPYVDSVLVNYLPKNVSPVIDDVNIQIGVRYQSLPKPSGPDLTIGGAPNPNQPRYEAPVPSTRDRDSIGVKWTAHDDNDDQLVYSVYYRGDNEARWLLLKDEITDKFYSFDASLLPDGGYTIKIVASDAPSHSPGEALSTEAESPRFEVDTTPPQIDALTAAVDGSQLHVTFRANDSFSPLKRAEYSIDAGDWQYVEPVGELSDSKTENYDFRVKLAEAEHAAAPPAPSAARNRSKQAKAMVPDTDAALEHIVVVRVYDRYDNMGSAKTVVRGKPQSAASQ
jgi:hypothetical protein